MWTSRRSAASSKTAGAGTPASSPGSVRHRRARRLFTTAATGESLPTKGRSAMADVRIERVTKRYGQNPPVISDLSLHIDDHEFLVLVGPSGCGKSTALRMIA